MIKQFRHQDILWVDVTKPTKEDLDKLAKEYNLHSLVENELATPSSRSHADVYDSYVYMVLHFPACYYCTTPKSKKKNNDDNQEVDFILGKNFLITVHYEPIQTLDEFGQIFEANFIGNTQA